MKLKYLGTAAAEGIPGLFCNCTVCRHARENGGRNLRTRSQAILDDTLLIDFPCDTYYHAMRDGIDFCKIENVIITHAHNDHLYPPEFAMRRIGFVPDAAINTLHIYGSSAVEKKLFEVLSAVANDNIKRYDFYKITPYTAFLAGDYRVTPLEANHDKATEPVIYMIEKSGKSLLYAHDTGYFPEATWKYIAESGIRFDLVSLDSTMGFKESRNGHMGVMCVREVIARLRSMGTVNDKTVFIANHFTHNAKGTYEDFAEYYGKLGIITSYDSMEIEF